MAQTKYSSEDVAAYYNEYTPLYLNTTGEFIQAFRPADTDALMAYIAKQIGITEGMHILDAGCGVGAAAIWIVQNFKNITVSCITNSLIQYEIALEKIRTLHLESRITVTLGDYHTLTRHYPESNFDIIFFLESLGHAHAHDQVINQSSAILKKGGRIYIKDFFIRESTEDEEKERIEQVINAINSAYLYHTMRLPLLVKSLVNTGLTIDFIKRPELPSDVNITIAFEERSRRLTYPLFMGVPAADWYETLAVKY